MTPKDEPSRLIGGQYATEEEHWNSSGKNEEVGLKQEWIQLWMCLVVKVKSDVVRKILPRIWDVKSMNQGELDMVKQEMERVNFGILGISELKWMGMGEFNSYEHCIYYCGQELLKRNGVALIQFSCSVVSNSLLPHGLQHARLPCPSSTPRACSNSGPSSRWCHHSQ